MKSDIQTKLLLHTTSEINHQLANWIDYLSGQYYLELGADPGLIQQIEKDMLVLARRVRALRSHFNLRKLPLNLANYYYAAAQEMDAAASLTSQIRRQAFGSEANTQQCIEQFNRCIESVNRVSDLFLIAPSAVQH